MQRAVLFQTGGINFDKPLSVKDIATQWSEITSLSSVEKQTQVVEYIKAYVIQMFLPGSPG
ncbi:hypothetical protein A3216_06155 [Mycobacterium leprae 7935681]|nr:hypothetical protein A3216_06155 [Mycobacterium leprae 7935681]